MRCRWLDWCGIRLTCGPRLWTRIEEGLKGCGGEFFIRCPGFDKIGPECNFELAFDAHEWRQKVEIEKLQTRIETLEARVKKKGWRPRACEATTPRGGDARPAPQILPRISSSMGASRTGSARAGPLVTLPPTSPIVTCPASFWTTGSGVAPPSPVALLL